MNQFREAIARGREAFLRESSKAGSLVAFFFIGAVVAIVNLFVAYKAHSIFKAIAAVVLWMIIFPLFAPLLGRWTSSAKK